MKKKLNTLILILFIISIPFFCLSFKLYMNIHKFNPDSVIKTIHYLSSDTMKGRLTGSIENYMTQQFLKSEFKSIGLKPLSKDYFQTFSTNYPHIIEHQKPYLNIVDENNNLIKEFKYGKDYKEDMLNFKTNSIEFDKFNCKVSTDAIKATINNKSVIFFCPQDNLNFRSSFSENSPSNMYIMLSKSAFSTILKHIKNNDKISCYLPYDIKKANVSNVIGEIEGKNKNLPPIVICAHFDHVGYDLNGTVYNGALDNASGVSFVLEMSRYLKSLGKPNRNIIFVGMNGEEFGLIGSTAFVQKYHSLLKDAKVLNFDMIGGSKSIPLCIMGSKKDTSQNKFIKSICKLCEDQKINYKCLFEDASDHVPFRYKNIDAVTFCDDDTKNIHTPNDKIDFIERNSIVRCFNVSSKEILNLAYNHNFFINNYKIIFITSSISLIFCLYYFIISSFKRKRLN